VAVRAGESGRFSPVEREIMDAPSLADPTLAATGTTLLAVVAFAWFAWRKGCRLLRGRRAKAASTPGA
jgi:hypothetical protein